jgi:hypothetical protein
MILISPSWAMKRLCAGNRVRFELRSEATVVPIEVQTIAQMVWRVVIEFHRLSVTFEGLQGVFEGTPRGI